MKVNSIHIFHCCTLSLPHPLTLILAHPNPDLLVNETEDPGAITSNVQLKESLFLATCEVLCGGSVTPPKWVVSFFGGCGGMALTSFFIVSRLCYDSGHINFVDFCWASVVSQIFIERGHP